MKEIPLTQGKVALVDDGDFDFLNKWKWFAFKSRNQWYAARQESRKEARKAGRSRRFVFMHHEVIGERVRIDHIDGNGLNNRRKNLRRVSHEQNCWNAVGRKKTSVFKGVSWDRSRNKWRAVICVGGKYKTIGRFSDEEEAARAYDEEAKKSFGEYARLNFGG